MEQENKPVETALRCPAENRHTVRKGDTMTSIAQEYGVSPAELIALNPYVSPNALVVGQVICVPTRPAEDAAPPQDADAPGDASQGTTPPNTGNSCSGPCCTLCPEGWTRETVRAGESYADLLIRYDISLRAMRIANPRLLPGLMIPGQAYCLPPEEDRRSACPAQSRSYTLTPGETLETVAAKFNLSAGKLLRYNPDRAPSEFATGATICLPT